MDYIGTATYSPDDNKIRIYPFARLDKELYERVRASGFIWAPMQKIFVAPMWTPQREDLALELCGEIEDEDKSLIERAEERAERFEGYSENRAKDAEASYKAVDSIASNIPMGQPILIGHHSEKRARRDAEKIENGMRKAVKMWETSKYWTDRAEGAIAHAKYKEMPRTRARRIKKIEAEIRQMISSYTPKNPDQIVMQTRWYCPVCKKMSCQTHSEAQEKVPHVFCGQARGGSWVPVESLPKREKYYERWIAHCKNRLIYEKAMLNEQGASALIEKKPRPKQLPLCNYRAPEGIKVPNIYHKDDFSIYPQVEMTKEEYAKLRPDTKFTVTIEHSHRVRAFVGGSFPQRERHVAFIVDLKETPKPESQEENHKKTVEKKHREKAAKELQNAIEHPYVESEKTKFDTLKENLKKGVQVVSAPELFPTPPELAQRMVEEADIQEDHRVLEPSAGTGNILREIGRMPQPDKVAIEINPSLIPVLMRVGCSGLHIIEGDFLTMNGELGNFDRIIMNPPFSADVEHVRHAYEHLKEGGRIVAIMSEHSFFANDKKSVAFREWLEECGTSEQLPKDTFKESGTMVATRLVIIDK